MVRLSRLLGVLIVLFWVIVAFCFLWLSNQSLPWSEKKTIHILAWAQTIDPQALDDFETESGIELSISYYESNEEMLMKIQSTAGDGYDLVMPSDYAVKVLKDGGLLEKIDKSKLNFFQKLNPMFLNHYFDPKNEYSIPFYSAIYVIGFNKKRFKNTTPPTSWANIFLPKESYGGIVIPNDIREVICMAAKHLFGNTKNLNPEQVKQIKKALLKQKKQIEAYSDFRSDLILASRNSDVAVSNSSYIWQGMIADKNIDFVIPEEGSFITIENIVIPARSNNKDLVYKLLNHIYSFESMKRQSLRYAFVPVRTDVLEAINEEDPGTPINLTKAQLKKASFFRFDSLTEDQINDIWITLKS